MTIMKNQLINSTAIREFIKKLKFFLVDMIEYHVI